MHLQLKIPCFNEMSCLVHSEAALRRQEESMLKPSLGYETPSQETKISRQDGSQLGSWLLRKKGQGEHLNREACLISW